MKNLTLKAISFILILILLSTSVASSFSKENNNKLLAAESDENTPLKEKMFDFYIDFLMKIGRIPSLSAGIVKNDSLIWSKGYGYADIENQKPVDKDTIYMLGSTSKAITATAMMQLYENGEFDLEDDINNYIDFNFRNPKYPDNPITFRMVLSHSSGLKKLPFPKLSVIPNDETNSIDPYAWLKECLTPEGRYYIPDLFWDDNAPGEKFSYSNIHYLLLAYILENITQQPFNEYCTQNIFIPLGMKNTSYSLNDLDVENIAKPYVLDARIFRTYIPLEYYSTYFFPAADLKTTIEDIYRFLLVHMNDGEYNGVRILNKSTIELMHTIQPPEKNGWQYGLGWIVWEMPDGVNYSGHYGAVWGYYTCMKIRESDNSAVIYFMNIIPEDVRGALAQMLIERALFNKASRL